MLKLMSIRRANNVKSIGSDDDIYEITNRSGDEELWRTAPNDLS